jgi:hypothetical protein
MARVVTIDRGKRACGTSAKNGKLCRPLLMRRPFHEFDARPLVCGIEPVQSEASWMNAFLQ